MKYFKFTLIEIVIATLILALSVTIAIEMSTRAHLSTINAEEEWGTEHLLTLGCEFYLLFGPDAERPDFLPPGYSLTCEINEGIIPDGEEELEKYDPSSGWVIGEYTIKLSNQDGELGSISIDKLVPADSFE